MNNFRYTSASSSDDDELPGEWHQPEEDLTPNKITYQPIPYRLHEMKLQGSLVVATPVKVSLDHFHASLAKCNQEAILERMKEVDKIIEPERASAEANGVNFNRQHDREYCENEGAVKDFRVLISNNTFPQMPSADQYTIIKWYRYGRNWWGHGNEFNSLVYIRHFYTAIIHLTGPAVLNVPCLHSSLKEDLRSSQLSEVPIAELRATKNPPI